MKKLLFAVVISLIFALSGCNSDDLNSLETKISTLEDDISALQLLLSEDEDYDDTLTRAEILTLQGEIVSLLDEATALQTQIDLLVTDDENKQTTIDSLLLDITALEDELGLIEDFNLYVSPVFSNIPGNQVIEYQTDLDLLSLGITALDNIDGDVTSSITVDVDDTTILTMGNHPVTYSVTDSNGNITTTTLNLEVDVFESEFTFVLINDRSEIKITGFSGYNSAFLIIPNNIGGLPVTEIGDDSFRSKGLIEVTLPETLVTIGNSAFFDNSILEILLPASVISVGNFAFASNSLNNNILLRNECMHVGESAFRDNNLLSVGIGAYITDIGNDAFSGNNIIDVYIFGNSSRFDSRWEDIGLPIELLGVQ